MKRALVLSLSMLLLAPLPFGCTGGDQPKSKAATQKPHETVKKPSNDPAAKARKKELAEKIDKLSAKISKDPLNWDRLTEECDRYIADANDGAWKDLVGKLEGMKKDVKAAFESAAMKETDAACAQARKYIADGELKKARNRTNLARTIQNDPRFWSKILAVLAEIDMAERADEYYGNVTKPKTDRFKQDTEWERAEGVLLAFLAIPSFQKSPHVKDVEAELANVRPEADKVRAAQQAENAISWTPTFNGAESDLGAWELTDPGSLRCKDKEVTFAHTADEPDTLSMMYGKDEWEDYVVDLTLRVEKGPVYIDFHGTLEGPEDGRTRSWQPGVKLEEAEKDSSVWSFIHCEVRGDELRFSLPNGQTSTRKLKFKSGPFEIRIQKGSVVHVKSIWVKVLKPAATPEKK